MKGFVVYKSSAGSGKTFTLVREYLAVVLKEPEKFRHVLAVTFTNKAASEMKGRVINYLRGIADPATSLDDTTLAILREQLIAETGLGEKELEERAAWVLKQIMHHYTEFAVGTIDSFMHRVVRAFAFDLGIPVNFEVEIEADAMLSQAVDILISRAGIDGPLTNTLVSFVESKTSEEKSWDIERDLLKTSAHLFREEARPYLYRLEALTMEDYSRIKHSLYSFLVSYEKQLTGLASDALELIFTTGLTVDSFRQKGSGLAGYFKKILDGRFEELEPNSYVRGMADDGELTAKNASPEIKQMVTSIKDELLGYYEKIQELRSAKEGSYLVLKRVYQNIHQLALLSELARIIDEFRKQDSLVHISEFNRRIYEFVIREPVPFIYERLGEKFRHYLVDEFQDTSLQQWHNLLPLVENALSYANYNMVVGDGKQAIYRFRAGDVEQFTKLPGLLKADNEVTRAREKILRENYIDKNLDVNYRSGAEIVRFNNNLFTTVATWLDERYRHIYNDIVQKEGKKKGGYVRLDFVDNKDEYDRIQLETVQRIVRECTADNHPWSDIAVLCRDNLKASTVARYLLQNNIDVISSESLLVGSASSVMFIVAYLKIIHRPEEINSYITLMKILEGRKLASQEELLSLLSVIRKNRKDPRRWKIVRDEAFHIMADKGLPTELPHFMSLDLYELVEEIARSSGLLDHRDPYLLSFLDAVREQVSKGKSDPADFLEWWEDNKGSLSVVIPEGIEAVRVMTIHKAKGLQFPVVIYPFADQKKTLTRKELWVSLDEPAAAGLPAALVKADQKLLVTSLSEYYQEESDKSYIDLVNLLYVALTRPMERLYVVSRYRDKTPDKMDTVGKILQRWLTERSLWKQDELVYTFGERIKKKEGKSRQEGAVMEKMISEPWSDRFRLRMNAPYYWDVEDPEQNRRWGNLVHMVFSRIIHENEVGGSIESLVAEGAISAAEKESLAKAVIDVLRMPAVKPFFSEEYTVLNEAEVITAKGQVYRPDRLLLKDREAVVIDFKTGRHREEYALQLGEYARILEDMGYHVSEKALIYVGPEVSVVTC